MPPKICAQCCFFTDLCNHYFTCHQTQKVIQAYSMLIFMHSICIHHGDCCQEGKLASNNCSCLSMLCSWRSKCLPQQVIPYWVSDDVEHSINNYSMECIMHSRPPMINKQSCPGVNVKGKAWLQICNSGITWTRQIGNICIQRDHIEHHPGAGSMHSPQIIHSPLHWPVPLGGGEAIQYVEKLPKEQPYFKLPLHILLGCGHKFMKKVFIVWGIPQGTHVYHLQVVAGLGPLHPPRSQK